MLAGSHMVARRSACTELSIILMPSQGLSQACVSIVMLFIYEHSNRESEFRVHQWSSPPTARVRPIICKCTSLIGAGCYAPSSRTDRTSWPASVALLVCSALRQQAWSWHAPPHTASSLESDALALVLQQCCQLPHHSASRCISCGVRSQIVPSEGVFGADNSSG